MLPPATEHEGLPGPEAGDQVERDTRHVVDADGRLPGRPPPVDLFSASHPGEESEEYGQPSDRVEGREEEANPGAGPEDVSPGIGRDGHDGQFVRVDQDDAVLFSGPSARNRADWLWIGVLLSVMSASHSIDC